MTPSLNSVAIVLLTAALTFAVSWFWYKKKQSDKKSEEREKRLHDIENQLATVGAAVLPINAAFQAILIKELTHFHTPRMDALMVKLGPPYVITPPEEVELLKLLKAREKDLNGNIPEPERDGARMLPMVMKRVKAENEALANAPTELKLVAVVPEKEEEPEA